MLLEGIQMETAGFLVIATFVVDALPRSCIAVLLPSAAISWHSVAIFLSSVAILPVAFLALLRHCDTTAGTALENSSCSSS